MKPLEYIESVYQTTQVNGFIKQLDQPIAILSVFKPDGSGASLYLDKKGAEIIGKWLLEFAESPDDALKMKVG